MPKWMTGETNRGFDVQLRQSLERPFRVIKHHQFPANDFTHAFEPCQRRDQPLMAHVVFDRDQSFDPMKFPPFRRNHGTAETVLADEVFQVDPHRRIEPTVAGKIRCRPGGREMTERIGLPHRIAPEPPDFSLIDRRQNRILTDDLTIDERLGNRHRFAEHHAVSINPFTGHPIQSLGEIDPFDLQLFFPAGSQFDRHAVRTESIRREIVPLARDAEKHMASQQSRIINRGVPGTVRPERNITDRLQLHQRHPPARAVINDLDRKRSRDFRPAVIREKQHATEPDSDRLKR